MKLNLNDLDDFIQDMDSLETLLLVTTKSHGHNSLSPTE